MAEVALAPLGLVLVSIWLMLPAYLANTIASIVGGGPPIDGGRNWTLMWGCDGQRILGDGNTWNGLIGGTVGGLLVGHLQMTTGKLCFRQQSRQSAHKSAVPTVNTRRVLARRVPLRCLR